MGGKIGEIADRPMFRTPVQVSHYAGDARRARSGHDGCRGIRTERDSEGPCAAAGRRLGRAPVEEAGKRLVLDWTQPLRHGSLYKATYRPTVLCEQAHADREARP